MNIKTLFLFILISLIIPSWAECDIAVESTCYGTTKNGGLENGVKLPKKGPNFLPYSSLGVIAGRTYVHSKVCEVIINAFESLEKTNPDKIYMYGETGFKNGGRFKPHKTHQSGLSVDFMVPVLNADGHSVPLPTSPFNKFGYSIEFDKYGRYREYFIDFEAIAAHLKALHIEAKKAGIDIGRVIFDPELQPHLFKSKDGAYLKENLVFSKKGSWVRHDEHYHVDFKVKCNPL